MKRALAVILSVIMLLSCCTVAFAAEKATINDKGEKVLKFNTDGKFKILQINDTQDTDKLNKRTEAFIRAAVAQEKLPRKSVAAQPCVAAERAAGPVCLYPGQPRPRQGRHGFHAGADAGVR